MGKIIILLLFYDLERRLNDVIKLLDVAAASKSGGCIPPCKSGGKADFAYGRGLLTVSVRAGMKLLMASSYAKLYERG
jgi:hypothetical protein